LTKFDQKIICVCPYDSEWVGITGRSSLRLLKRGLVL
jgi:hypothetical protein